MRKAHPHGRDKDQGCAAQRASAIAIDEAADDLEELPLLLNLDKLAGVLDDDEFGGGDGAREFLRTRTRRAEVVVAADDEGRLFHVFQAIVRIVRRDHVDARESDLLVLRLCGARTRALDPFGHLIRVLVHVAR